MLTSGHLRPVAFLGLWRCITYLMKRTQLYLDDDLWNALHERARSEGTSISELVRQAARERYLGKLDGRREAMEALVGIRKGPSDLADSTEHVRGLRRCKRLERLGRKLPGRWTPTS